MVGLILIVVVVGILVVLGFDQNMCGNLFGFFGIIVFVVIVLLLMIFFGNVIVGYMLCLMQYYCFGDYLCCGEYFGCVLEQGFFYIEIQMQDCDLMMFLNFFLVMNLVMVVLGGGIIVLVEIGLGYDVLCLQVEQLFFEVVQQMGFEEVFVSVMELQDYVVVY